MFSFLVRVEMHFVYEYAKKKNDMQVLFSVIQKFNKRGLSFTVK